MLVCSGNPYICWYLSVRWLGVLPNPRLAGGGGGSSSPSDLEPGSGLSASGGGGGGARFAIASVVGRSGAELVHAIPSRTLHLHEIVRATL